MKRYVIGFLFDSGYVALIQKNRPDWQKGLLNGIGGHIEDGETAKQAIVREFKEEAGCDGLDWREFCLMRGEDWAVHCFTAENNGSHVKTMTDEMVKFRFGAWR